MQNIEDTVTPIQPEDVTPPKADVPLDPPSSGFEELQLDDATATADDVTATAEASAASFGDLELDPNAEEKAALVAAQAQVLSLQEQVKSLTSQLEQRTEQYVRIAADFENFRNRTQKEKDDLREQAKCTALGEVLPVLDNFERAKDHLVPQGEEALQIHKSYQGLYKQFVESLKRAGVAPMRAEGKPFDPMLHDAMLREPTAEYEEGIVMAELQRGYMLGDRVLRHAMVKVAAPPEVDEEEPQGAQDSE
ncbi:nucleotide exchange factor GrpE [Prochlorothrix hollandica]|uniref:Protein GrpE n=1 Tax=Prochlorothrix hollandica PCC 9006 = CALU 1027 TaxID=317619 RepID=A0A0M2PU03_PROHO|nr:nucleotide exchange factor GrpE [Prochlorothrix hollandica]KKI98612.1 molecular chaperone GrpE [Prochlorothrix hollandica PCC 9006 = CALU 1027]